MRKRFDAQIGLDQVPIEKVIIPHKSRDELPPVLAGLQWIFATPEVNQEIFALLEEKVCGDKKDTGRPGMDLWHILVLGVVRLALDCDYDRLEHVAEYDRLVRAIMGVADFGGQEQFHHKTISDNVCHVDAELLEKINEIVVRHGRQALKKNGAEKLEVKTDSYVPESNIHHPTDCNLLWDAARKCVELLDNLHESLNLGGWRKAKYWKRQIKKAMRACEKLASSGGANKAERVAKSAQEYVALAGRLEEKVRASLEDLKGRALSLVQLVSLQRIGYSLSAPLLEEIRATTRTLAKVLGVVGLMNIQFAIDIENKPYIIEVNPRASRTVPFVSKATGVPLAKMATCVMLGQKLSELGLTRDLDVPLPCVKTPVFPFIKFPGFDPRLTPEMRSTGEVMGSATDVGMAYYKAQLGAGTRLPDKGTAFITVNERDHAVGVAERRRATAFSSSRPMERQLCCASMTSRSKKCSRSARGVRIASISSRAGRCI